jgi:hypothetical protein
VADLGTVHFITSDRAWRGASEDDVCMWSGASLIIWYRKGRQGRGHGWLAGNPVSDFPPGSSGETFGKKKKSPSGKPSQGKSPARLLKPTFLERVRLIHASKCYPRVRTIDEYRIHANDKRLHKKANDRAPYKHKRRGKSSSGSFSRPALFFLLELLFPRARRN